jgi:hypothetical protein
MGSKRTCPECHLIFEAESPETGVLVCPLCNRAFAAFPAAGTASTTGTPQHSPPTTSGRHVLRGIMAVGAIFLLGCGLGYAYYLAGGFNRNATVEATPLASTPSPSDSHPLTEIVPQSPAEPAPIVTVPRSMPIIRTPERQPIAIPEQEPLSLTLPERVNRAIDRGVAYLLARHPRHDQYRRHLGLLGLTLLECGVPADDPSVQEIAGWIRSRERDLAQTYELTLAILFLDRLGDPRDDTLIRIFGQQLLSGQLDCGSWTYSCLTNDRPSVASNAANASKRGPARMANGLPIIPPMPAWPNDRSGHGRPARQRIIYRGDNSNTQFAILGLWVAQRHGLPAQSALLANEQYFRATQLSDGSWAYNPNGHNWRDSNTCAGLMSLAMRYGVISGQGRDIRQQQKIHIRDAAINQALRHLAQSLDKITPAGNRIAGVDARDALYFLWSLERMAVIYDLRIIGKREWYPWAAEMLVEMQRPDGQWPGSDPVETCFALLILKRSNLAKDLQLAVNEPPSRPKPAVSGPTILQGLDALLGQTSKSQSPAPLEGTAKSPSPSPPLGPPVMRMPNTKSP